MTKALRYTPEAAIDVSTAFEWYESREPGLREEFLRCIEACTDMIQRHPEIFPVAVDQFRRGLIRRFPFELFYEASEGVSSSTPYFIVLKIRRGGKNV
jgi:plasmid stabilization system protein ParE